jgi:hypothetical protein
VFTHASNSKVGAADVITDVQHGDKIDLRLMDANTRGSGNQAFKFVSEFTGQLEWDKTSWDTWSAVTSMVTGELTSQSKCTRRSRRFIAMTS